MLAAFIDFPLDLYEGDRYYVPELFIAQRDLLTPGKHPFHKHSVIQPMLALEHGKIRGRIAAIFNTNYNEFNHTTDGFFGFFDSVDDPEVANALFSAAEQWLREKGANTMIGPVNPTTNDPCGMLLEGFDLPPVAMMPYNKAYYNDLVLGYGFQKKVDLLAHQIITAETSTRSILVEEKLKERLKNKGITIRTVNPKNLKVEAAKVKEVYNAAWDKNLGFVPMTDEEFQYLAKDLSMVLDKNFCLIAEHNGAFIGFALGIPDINQVLKKVRRGRLLPFGWLHLLLGLKKIDGVRILALGVKEEYRKMGIEACFYAGFIRRAKERGIVTAEASWILEHNELMNKGIESLGGKVYKRYRIYERSI